MRCTNWCNVSMSRVHVSVTDLRSLSAVLWDSLANPWDVYLAACGLPELNRGEVICTEIY